MNSKIGYASSLNAIAKSDLQPLLDDLQSGNFRGDQISGTGYTVFKVRLKNSDIQKGESAGYRVIYQLKNANWVLLAVIYSKSDQSTITADQIRAIIDDFTEPGA